MANSNGWGDGASNNNIGWGKGADNAIGWGAIHADSWAGLTDIVGTPAFDPDAQAFITAASITDLTQQTAINQLVVDLKGYNIWTKMKALYPFVGGTATTHKWNLKDPRDLNAAFRIFWNGGVTHGANGVQFEGVNGAGNTFLTPSTSLSLNSTHLSFYSRTNTSVTSVEIGSSANSGVPPYLLIQIKSATNNLGIHVNDGTAAFVSNSDGRGFYIVNRTASNIRNSFKNATKVVNDTQASTGLNSNGIWIGAYNANGTSPLYSNKQCAFASIGDGLTDTEAANFYTAVQAFQVTLGRSIGTQTVSDADAQAFVTNANIQDQVQATAVNNLVIGMKADGLWSKMKAVYPFVGGDASSHKFNLKNPLDTDAAFRLVFNGGWTHSSNGATPNGTNAYADTKLTGNLLQQNSSHLSIYSRTDTNGSFCDMGVDSNSGCLSIWSRMNNLFYNQIHNALGNYLTVSNTNSNGLHIANRTASTTLTSWKNGIKLTTGSNASSTPNSRVILLGALNDLNSVGFFSPRQQAFASIGDGLSDTEAANLYTRVQNFNTALSRQV